MDFKKTFQIVFIIILTISVIFFGTTMNILIHMYINIIKNAQGSIYYILIINEIPAICIFGVCKVITNIKRACVCYSWKVRIMVFFIGFLDGITGICILYTSDSTRTPIVLQSILSGISIFFTIIISKLIIKSKKIKFCNCYVIISLALVLSSIILCIIPQFAMFEWKWISLLWISIYLMGILCKSIYFSLQEKYIEMTKNTIDSYINMLSNTSIYRLMTEMSLVFVEITPFFGYTKIFDFYEHSTNFYACYFTIICEWYILFIGILFSIAYISYNVCIIVLNSKSANYSTLVLISVSSFVILFFEVFPSWNKGIRYPLYITIPALVLNIIGLIIWQVWELKKMKEKDTNKDITEDKIEDKIEEDKIEGDEIKGKDKMNIELELTTPPQKVDETKM